MAHTVRITTLAFICTTFAFPTSSTTLDHRSALDSNSKDCVTNADNDLYGRGVRIGLYLQWASGFILRNFDSFEVRSRVRVVSNTLCAAIALATVVNIMKGSALSIDYLLSYYLTVVLFYAESYNLEVRVKESHGRETQTMELQADAALVCQNIIFTAFTLFGAWYWLEGIKMTTDPACGASLAMLVLFDIHNATWTHAAAGLAVITGTAFFLVFLVHLASLKEGIASGPVLVARYYADRMRYFSGPPPSGLPDTLRVKLILKKILRPGFHDMGGTGREMTVSTVRIAIHFTHWALINLVGPLIAMISVERMITANRLVTAPVFSSAGQVIALFSGVTSTLLACWEIIAKYYRATMPPGPSRRTASISSREDEDEVVAGGPRRSNPIISALGVEIVGKAEPSKGEETADAISQANVRNPSFLHLESQEHVKIPVSSDRSDIRSN